MECHLRVHQSACTQDVIEGFLREMSTRWYLVLEEDASRPHYQMYIQFKDKYKSLQSMRNKVKAIAGTGNRNYSLSPLRKTPVDLICYLMKEGNLLSSHSIPTKWLEDAERQQDEIRQAQETRDARRSSKPQSIVQMILESFPEDFDFSEEPKAQVNIAKYVLRWFYDRKRLLPDPQMLRRYIYTISMYRGGATSMVDYLREMYQFDSPLTLEAQADLLKFFSQ